MKLFIRCHGLAETDAIYEHARTRIRFALEPILDGQGTVSVHVSDQNGPRGALERCSIRINGSELDVHVVAVDEDPRRAVDLACSRAAAHAIERRKANRVA